MWSYYGAKTKVVHLYPKPKYDRIIEPFAGSARYALRYFEHDVLLVDKSETIVEIWKWLQQCSPSDVLNLPKLKPTQKTTDYNLTKVERAFLGFLVQRGVSRPGITTSAWKDTNSSPTVADDLKRIAASLFKIKHWTIQLGEYSDAPDVIATHFIDPPYEFGGHKYPHSSRAIDFTQLSDWCMSRKGQVIVCENERATWMDFKPLAEQQGIRRSSVEAIWTNEHTVYNNTQQKLFA